MPASDADEQAPDHVFLAATPSPSPPPPTPSERKRKKKAKKALRSAAVEVWNPDDEKPEAEAVLAFEAPAAPTAAQENEKQTSVIGDHSNSVSSPSGGHENTTTQSLSATAIPPEVGEAALIDIAVSDPSVPQIEETSTRILSTKHNVAPETATSGSSHDAEPSPATPDYACIKEVVELDKPKQTPPSRRKPASQTRDGTVHSPPASLLQPHYLSSIHNQNFYASAATLASSKRADGEMGCCRFDSFADSGDLASASKVKDALLVGSDGGLDIYRVIPNKMEVVGRLEGLHGTVMDAKVLPAIPGTNSEQACYPLVIVVLHSALSTTNGTLNGNVPDGISVGQVRMQASVEVFSLRNQKRIATLFTSLPATLSHDQVDISKGYPDILGGLRVHANGHFISISSSISGEVYIFQHALGKEFDHEFRCIAKFWTSLQAEHPTQSTKSTAATDKPEKMTPIQPLPLLALGSRWLVVSCPSSSARISIQGSPLLPESFQPFGVGSHNPPMQPAISAEVIAVDGEGVVSRVTRQAAQELLKASRKGLELGLAGWREFTNPSHPERNTVPARAENDGPTFPPTHAPVDSAQREEPAVLSIIDLQRFVGLTATNSRPTSPFASTFAIQDGCNFMSLSNDGLNLFATSRSGEVSYAWNLRHAFFSSLSSSGDAESEGPSVECIHRMQRNSPCVVTNVKWSTSDTELAIQTMNGTTHLHYLSANNLNRGDGSKKNESSQRYRANSRHSVTAHSPPESSPPSAFGMLTSIRSSWQSVSTHVNALRSTTTATQPFDISTTFAGLRESANAARVASGRAVARGIVSSYSAARTGVGDLWHADENKIKSGDTAATTSLQWIQTADSMCLGLAHGGKLSVYTILKASRMRGKTEFIGLKVEKGSRMEFVLPFGGTAPQLDTCSQQGPHGYWSLRPPASAAGALQNHDKMQPANEVFEDDVITNPLFCPFHVDPRVSMMVYSDGAEAQQQQHASANEQTFWCFGEPLLPSVKVNNDNTSLADLVTYDGASDAMIESRITVHPLSQEILINSHRTKDKDFEDDAWNNAFED